jgi:xanthine dehydrogenase YagR molybdenum-binding subunit
MTTAGRTTDPLGKPSDRVDGRLKVTGAARYAAEFNPAGLAHGVVVSSTIAKGRITRIDTLAARQVPGVVQVFTHENVPALARFDLSYKDMAAPAGAPFRPLAGNEIRFSMQPIALVVAETLEQARCGASLVQVAYEAEPALTDLKAQLNQAYPAEKPVARGDFAAAFGQAEVKLEAEYFHGAEHHNPLEMHAATVLYEPDGGLTVYDKTQGVVNTWHYLSMVFGLPKKKIRVLSPYVGGAFGSGLRPQYQLFLAVLAALELKRPVKVGLTRPQMFSLGHRPFTLQQLALGAARDGTLQAIRHGVYAGTSRFEDYSEMVTDWSGLVYQCDHVLLEHHLVALDVNTPMDMRAPGGATGMFALECALDELAAKLGMDPLALRLKNYSEEDQSQGKPYSSKELRECYRQGADHFGWARRPAAPRSMPTGRHLVGWGMATGCWFVQQKPARARAVLTADGKLTVSSATADLGTGTYTIMAQVAAQTLGLPLEQVTAELGDSDLPLAPNAGGSETAASIGSAVQRVCEKLKATLLQFSRSLDNSPFTRAGLDEVTFAGGQIKLNSDPTQALYLTDIMRRRQLNRLKETTTSLPKILKQRKYAFNSHSAVFVEVKVDEDLGTVQVSRVVSAVAAGRILNPKTARSQILGGVVWGMGMALQEDSVLDPQFGRFINHDLAGYHVPVHADMPEIEVLFVDESDPVVNPLGVKGVGEIGLVGVAAAIANAVYHATGKRVRELPITLDKLL